MRWVKLTTVLFWRRYAILEEMSIVSEPIPGQTPAQEESEPKTHALELIELEKKTQGLGSFIHLLETSNRVREDIETGKLDNLSSSQVFDRIWKTHVGDSLEEQALAYAEGGGYSVEDWLDALRKGVRPPDAKGAVRVVKGLPPLLFEVPKALKPQVLAEFFKLADKLIEDPKGTLYAYIPAVELQSHLNFIHPKQDANGRTTEDWMLWWQRQLVRKSEEQARKEVPTSFLGITSIPRITQDTIRSWYHHGLRAMYAGNEEALLAPPFLREEFRDSYIQGRDLMFSRTLEMQDFRRDMYEFLSEKLGYQGEPKNFESFINEHVEEAVEVFKELYSSEKHLGQFTRRFAFYRLEERLVETGEYSYQVLQPKDVIKPEYFPSF